MTTTRSLLVLGGSSATFSGDGASTSELLQTELSKIDPGWLVQYSDLWPGRRMADDAASLCVQHRPDVALVSLSAQPSVYESVLIRVRRRWPRLLGAASRFEAYMRRGAAGAPSRLALRSVAYRASQALGLAVLGGETLLATEHHIENVAACLQRLAGLEDTPILVRLPVGGASATAARRRRYEARLRALKDGIIEACRRHRIPYVDVAERLAEAGMEARHGADSVHLEFETRRFEARLLAAEVASLGAGMAADPAAEPVRG